jgi:membrane-bound lytic murein transglycosylase A
MHFRLRLPVLLVLLFSIFPFAELCPATQDIYKPLHLLEQQEYPIFSDDMGYDLLIESAINQLAYLKKQPPDEKILFGTDSYDNKWLLHSLQEFLSKLQQKPNIKELNQFIHENFLIYQAGGQTNQQRRNMLVTGYYEPLFSGSLTRNPPFLTPLYSPPKSLTILTGKDGKKKIGRYNSENTFVPFWSRAEIENNNLLQGNELVFLKDPFDAFLLHVQGSGRIQLPDHSIRSVRFAGSNGLEYNSIGKLLVDEKIMHLEEVNIPAIRIYLQRHPEQLQRVLHHNPRFIFFTWGDNLPPKGSSGERLTPGRSIAIDASALPGGTIGYLISQSPVADHDGLITHWQKLNRFVFPQDSGSAIKGTGRVDVFWGSGDYAELAANHMKEAGKLYFLIKKGYSGKSGVIDHIKPASVKKHYDRSTY